MIGSIVCLSCGPVAGLMDAFGHWATMRAYVGSMPRSFMDIALVAMTALLVSETAKP